MSITLTHKNNSNSVVSSFDDINDNEDIIKIDCSNNKLTHLPENMNFSNLKSLNCSGNKLTHLPENMNFPNLKSLDCSSNNLTHLPENMNFPNLKSLDCSSNNLTHLPENMNFPKLQKLYCRYNKLTKLPENMNFPKLKFFWCFNNNLTQLPENMNFPNLQIFYCENNNLTHLPENMNFPKLKFFWCFNNNLTQLPENMNFPNLQIFYCENNNLTHLRENMNFPNLQRFNCYNNKLTQLPVCILNWRSLLKINYINNPIELSPQLARFINRINNGFINNLNVYGDTQNVHNASIQVTIKDSINRLTTRSDLSKYNKDDLIKLTVEDKDLNCQEQLIEYCADDSIHSLLLLNFSEVLWSVLQTINKDFNEETQKEIKLILNQEMKDAECKCFTGRLNRVVNCLNGFSDLVKINIQDSEQIANIIFLIKEKLGNDYNVEKHKELASKELTERGYDEETIKTWVEFIE